MSAVGALPRPESDELRELYYAADMALAAHASLTRTRQPQGMIDHAWETYQLINSRITTIKISAPSL